MFVKALNGCPLYVSAELDCYGELWERLMNTFYTLACTVFEHLFSITQGTVHAVRLVVLLLCKP